MKRILLLLTLCATAQAATIFSLNPKVGSRKVGQTLQVSLYAANVSDLIAYQFDLTFSTNMAVQSIDSDGLFASDGVGVFYLLDNTAGLISFLSDALIGSAVLTGSDSLVKITFLLLNPGPFTIGFDTAAAYDSGYGLITADYYGANGIIEDAPASVPEPRTALLFCLGLTALALARRARAGAGC